MNFSAGLLKVLNWLVSFFVVVVLCIAGAYSVYALWDNEQVYEEAENVMSDMLEFKPEISEEDDEVVVSFSDLKAINPDVCAWVTLDDTKINYPVLQGETNLTYINTDIYGEFALAGSIYLDSRNSPDFSDAYSLLYGHHMEGGRMFGDLDKFKSEESFGEHRTGLLMTPDKVYSLEVYACVVVPASDSVMFDPKRKSSDMEALYKYVEKKALFYDKETAAKLRELGKNAKILAFSTCSSEFTDARTIVLAAMLPYSAEKAE